MGGSGEEMNKKNGLRKGNDYDNLSSEKGIGGKDYGKEIYYNYFKFIQMYFF